MNDHSSDILKTVLLIIFSPIIIAFALIGGVFGGLFLGIYFFVELLIWPFTELAESYKKRRRAKKEIKVVNITPTDNDTQKEIITND